MSAKRLDRLDREIMLDADRDVRTVALLLLDVRRDRRARVLARRSAWLEELGRLASAAVIEGNLLYGLEFEALLAGVMVASGWKPPRWLPASHVMTAIGIIRTSGGVEVVAGELTSLLESGGAGAGSAREHEA